MSTKKDLEDEDNEEEEQQEEEGGGNKYLFTWYFPHLSNVSSFIFMSTDRQ